jgi:hypothetical protein
MTSVCFRRRARLRAFANSIAPLMAAAVASCVLSVPETINCPSLELSTRADLLAARACREVDGDLILSSTDIERIAADDLPYLERVTGSIMLVGSSPLVEISLPALREVGVEPSEDILELGFDAMTLRRISLPALRSVHGTLSIVALGGLETLDLGQLEVVDDAFGLINLPRLAQLDLSARVRAGRLVAFEALCELPVTALPDTSALPAEQKRLQGVGCCTQSASDCPNSICTCQP